MTYEASIPEHVRKRVDELLTSFVDEWSWLPPTQTAIGDLVFKVAEATFHSSNENMRAPAGEKHMRYQDLPTKVRTRLDLMVAEFSDDHPEERLAPDGLALRGLVNDIAVMVAEQLVPQNGASTQQNSESRATSPDSRYVGLTRTVPMAPADSEARQTWRLTPALRSPELRGIRGLEAMVKDGISPSPAVQPMLSAIYRALNEAYDAGSARGVETAQAQILERATLRLNGIITELLS